MISLKTIRGFDKIERAILELPETPRDIVTLFEMMGLSGYVEHPTLCIVARYLTQITGIPVHVAKNNVRYHVSDTVKCLYLPEAIQEVIRMFDCHELTHLEDERSA